MYNTRSKNNSDQHIRRKRNTTIRINVGCTYTTSVTQTRPKHVREENNHSVFSAIGLANPDGDLTGHFSFTSNRGM